MYEHLMISYYDVMMIDGNATMNEAHTTRRHRLKELITCVRGRANLTKQKIVDFSSRQGPEDLRNLLAHAFAQRWEGLVLKPSNEPYFSKHKTPRGLPSHCWIKLKKDYIPRLGDTADFAVVGAGYSASRATELRCPNLKWTHFHIGCLRNKEQVIMKHAKPCFKVVDALDVNLTLVKHLNQHGQFCALPLGSLLSFQEPFMLDFAKGVSKMDVVFRQPFVFDVMGAGFEKRPNRDFFTIRFPRVLKVHNDRDWKECTTFDRLQLMAKVARTVPEDTKPCVAEWMKQLEQVDRGTKGSTVPWDLSDDDVETPPEAGKGSSGAQPTSQRRAKRLLAGPPFIRMDTQEMTDREQRLASGEVVQRPTSLRSHLTNWSESTLPTPPKSSPPRDTPTTPARQALSSIDSTNSTARQRKRSIADEQDSQISVTPKRRRVSPPVRKTKRKAYTNASIRPSANNKPPAGHKRSNPASSAFPSLSPLRQTNLDHPLQSFLVPKLSIGAAEALNSRSKPRIYKAMDPPSQDRQTTDDEEPVDEIQAPQESLIEDWDLQPTSPISPSEIHLPDLYESTIVLSPDISGMPYLTEDLLGAADLESSKAYDIFGGAPPITVSPFDELSPHDDEIADMIFLIEGRRHDSSLEMLKFLVGRVPSHGVFWVFDWRLVEDMFKRDIEDEKSLMGKRLVARFWYKPEGLKWFAADGEVHVVPEEKIEESMKMNGAFLRP